jgi:hypothetical protein
VFIKIVTLFAIAVLSMLAPGILEQALPREYSYLEFAAPFALTAVWMVVFVITYRSAGAHKRRTFWLLLLMPFVFCYPAWMAIISICAWFFNWCGGTPL